jgi:hypothetical protein
MTAEEPLLLCVPPHQQALYMAYSDNSKQQQSSTDRLTFTAAPPETSGPPRHEPAGAKPSVTMRLFVIISALVVLFLAIRCLIHIAVRSAFDSGNGFLVVLLIGGLLGVAGYLRYRRLTR